MRSTPGPVVAFLNSRPLEMVAADIYTITLIGGGTPLRWTGFDVPITIGGNTYATGPRISRSSVKFAPGVEISKLTITVSDDGTTLVAGLPLMQAIGQKQLDRALVQLDRVFSSGLGVAWLGPMTWFIGRVGPISPAGRLAAEITVNSLMELLNNPMPRNLIMPGCRWTLYDGGCTLTKASFGTNSTVASGSTKRKINCALAQANGYFDLGTVTFTSGANSGITVQVERYTVGVLQLVVPLPSTPQVGDAFTAFAGCDKTMTTCQNKFSNLINFGGEPFVPNPETAIGILLTLAASEVLRSLCGILFT